MRRSPRSRAVPKGLCSKSSSKHSTCSRALRTHFGRLDRPRRRWRSRNIVFMTMVEPTSSEGAGATACQALWGCFAWTWQRCKATRRRSTGFPCLQACRSSMASPWECPKARTWYRTSQASSRLHRTLRLGLRRRTATPRPLRTRSRPALSEGAEAQVQERVDLPGGGDSPQDIPERIGAEGHGLRQGGQVERPCGRSRQDHVVRRVRTAGMQGHRASTTRCSGCLLDLQRRRASVTDEMLAVGGGSSERCRKARGEDAFVPIRAHRWAVPRQHMGAQ